MKSLLKLSHPLHLLLTVLTYTLGAGIAHYLNATLNLASFWLGMLAMASLLVGAYWLVEYFRLPLTPLAQDETHRQRERFRVMLLQAAYAALTFSTIAILTLFLTHSLNLLAGIQLILAALLILAYAVPPLRLSESGYGELALAAFLGTLVPAAAFLLQTGAFHRLLPITTFPLTLLALACLLVAGFPTFAADQKFGRHSLLTRLTWQRAIPIHNLLVLGAFLFLAAAPLLNVPWDLIWPALLILPLALIQIIWLQRIAAGGRAIWNVMIPFTMAVFSLIIYLLALPFWTR